MSARHTAIRGNQIRDEVAGKGLKKDSNDNLAVDLNELDSATLDITADSITFVDNDDSESKKASFSDIVAAMAGNGLVQDSSSKALKVNVDDSTVEINSDTLRVKANGIGANELDESETYDFGSAGGAIKVGTPTSDNDAANKGYVDSVAQGLDVKASVRALATTNQSLSGTVTIDGVSLSDGDRVLLTGQSTASENGIWIVRSSSWERPSDFDTGNHAAGAFCFVEEGTNYADSGWVCTSDSGSDVIDTDDLAFTQFSGAGQITAGDGLSKSGNTLNVNVDDSTIEIVSDTLQVKDEGISEDKLDVNNSPSDGYFLKWNASAGKMEWADVTVSAVGNSDIIKEDKTSLTDGSTTNFNLNNTPVSSSVQVFLNGLLQHEGSGKDYTLSGSTISFAEAPASGDLLIIHYIKQ